MFFSPTGYRSCFSQLTEAIAGMTLQDAVQLYLANHFKGEMKGKLVRYISPEEQKEIDARRTAEALAARERMQLGPVEDEDDTSDADDEPCSGGCGMTLGEMDEFFECQHGEAFCIHCVREHIHSCEECRTDHALYCDPRVWSDYDQSDDEDESEDAA